MTVQRLIKPAVSCLIAGHILAIFVAPASVPPTSPLIDSTWAACSPYLHATNLNNGYHFFSPEPGYSTLLEYVGRNAQGELTHGVFPNQQTMRPRLLYHRYFMLTEFLGSFDEKDPLRQSVVQDFAAQLLREKQLVQVDLTLVRHHPSSRQAILIGNPLDSTESYEREELGTYTWDSLPQPRSL